MAYTMETPISSKDNGWQRLMEDADPVSHARHLRQDKRWLDYRIIVRSLVVNFESPESPAFMQVKGLGLVVFSELFGKGNLYRMHFGFD
ncbi:MAG: hypothetical protein WBO24_13380 [Nitrospirales bacterium]